MGQRQGGIAADHGVAIGQRFAQRRDTRCRLLADARERCGGQAAIGHLLVRQGFAQHRNRGRGFVAADVGQRQGRRPDDFRVVAAQRRPQVLGNRPVLGGHDVHESVQSCLADLRILVRLEVRQERGHGAMSARA